MPHTKTQTEVKTAPAPSANPIANPPKEGVVESGVTVESLLTQADVQYAHVFQLIKQAAALAVAESSQHGKTPTERAGWADAYYRQTLAKFSKHVRQQFRECFLVALQPNLIAIPAHTDAKGVTTPAITVAQLATTKHNTATAAKIVREQIGTARESAAPPASVTPSAKAAAEAVTKAVPENGSGKRGKEVAELAKNLAPSDWAAFVNQMREFGYVVTLASKSMTKAQSAKASEQAKAIARNMAKQSATAMQSGKH